MSPSQKFAEIKVERNKKKQWINIEQTKAKKMTGEQKRESLQKS